MLATKPMNEFLDELASSSPAPGGGSVSALAGAIGAALTSMVCRLTIGKKKYADVRQEMESVLQQSEELRMELSQLIDEDSIAFNNVMAAFGLPKETEGQQEARSAAIQEATKRATLVPLDVMRLSERALGLVRIVAERGNKNSITDAGVAALMLHAACEGAALNVRINLASLKDEESVRQTREMMENCAMRVTLARDDVLAIVGRSLG
ncbi:MAG TPA: methenyltetrahydrofolate cyclohydrolase [Bacteroidetes bacterium]|nr:methenyltetrahydrofolate cyclohydrolase [Bacteroidota bacterium]